MARCEQSRVIPSIRLVFWISNPQVDIELEELPSHEIVRRVAAGLADAGIVADFFDLGELQMIGKSRLPAARG